MSPPEQKNKISLLVQLLGDRDEFVRSRVAEELLRAGEDAIPFLEIAARGEDLPARSQAEAIIGALRPQGLREKFRRLSAMARENKLDLEEGILLIAEYGHPDVDTRDVRATLDGFAQELRPRLDPRFSPRQTVETLTNYFFREKGFSGNEADYFNPENSYFNRVLSRRTGIPITLSALCIVVARRLGLPVVGVGMPAHFIAKYESPREDIYFDPFNKGRVLTKADCADIVARFGFKFEERLLNKTPHREILLRILHNLIMIYNRNNKPERAKELTSYSNILLNLPETWNYSKPV
ncbi:MAG: hypothetical protein HY579_04765 [Nitrospinae bacterium]|nr:hypothetical protein [Nitrospinota bacterium]